METRDAFYSLVMQIGLTKEYYNILARCGFNIPKLFSFNYLSFLNNIGQTDLAA